MLPNPLTLLTGKTITWITVAAFVALSAFTVKLKLDNTGLSLEISKQKTELAQAREKAADERTQLIAAYRAKEGALVAQITIDKETANATIDNLTARAAVLSASLRDAKLARATAVAVSGPTTNPPTDQAVAGSDGTLVPAEIGESDVAEALRADTIRVELLRCYAAYDRAEQTMRLLNIQPLTESNPMSVKDPVAHLMSLGAESVAGSLIYRNQELGKSRNGVFQITPAGEAMLNIEEAVVIEKPAAEAPAVAAPAKAPRGLKATKADKSREAGNVPPVDATPVVAPVVVAAASAPDLGSLDSLLGE